MKNILLQTEHIEQLAQRYAQFKHFAFIGRKYNYAVALEGALKLKRSLYSC